MDRATFLSQRLCLYPNSQGSSLLNAVFTHSRAKIALMGLKLGSYHLFVHPKWSTTSFGKMC